MTALEDVVLCATCAVEHADPVGVCAICADERQWVPAGGQRWTTVRALAGEGHRTVVTEVEPGLLEITVAPKVGIGQSMHVITTPAGSLLWDPVGFLDQAAVAAIRARGPVLAIAASHPHMFGVQVAWAQALDARALLVAEADREWIRRPSPVIELWRDQRTLAPGLTLRQLGGHFPGSGVVHWSAGAEGRGVLLSSDTIKVNPDRTTVSFMRSYPNRIPLSAAVVQRLVSGVADLAFDRVIDNFGLTIATAGPAAIRRSADRQIAWARGDFDGLT